MKFLEKIQKLPEHSRKIIFWLLLAIIAVGLFGWWGSGLKKKLAGFQGEQFIEQLNLPDFPDLNQIKN